MESSAMVRTSSPYMKRARRKKATTSVVTGERRAAARRERAEEERRPKGRGLGAAVVVVELEGEVEDLFVGKERQGRGGEWWPAGEL